MLTGKLDADVVLAQTRNPDKYNKNAERNRLRAIELERRNIYQHAVQQAQRLAAIHDPSGVSFNVSPVVQLEDGTVVSREVLRRREERQAEKAALEQATRDGTGRESPAKTKDEEPRLGEISDRAVLPQNGLHPDRVGRVDGTPGQTVPRNISKKQQKKLALYEPRPPPPKPTIPEGVSIPDGEEDWLSLWDLPADLVERRVTREKKRKAAERKALRVKQQSGKAERRAARDEKRRVYREIKLEWKAIKGEQLLDVRDLKSGDTNNRTEQQTRQRTKIKSLEEEESKKIAVLINIAERKAAMDLCASLDFTIENTPGAEEIKPKASGMKGVEVDFDAIEKADKQGDIRLKQENSKGNSKRVDLGKAAADTQAEYISTVKPGAHLGADEFIKFEVGDGQDFQTLTYNHKLRRKLRRAMDDAETRKELLVRDRAAEYFKKKGEAVPPVLLTPSKPLNTKGHRILDNGKLETAKQERVRARMELTEFNTQMKVLRRQAKDAAVFAGLKKHAELTGKLKETTEQVKAATPSMAGLHVDGGPSVGDCVITIGDGKRSLSDSGDTSNIDGSVGSDSWDATSISEASPESAESDASSRGDDNLAKRRKLHGDRSSK